MMSKAKQEYFNQLSEQSQKIIKASTRKGVLDDMISQLSDEELVSLIDYCQRCPTGNCVRSKRLKIEQDKRRS